MKYSHRFLSFGFSLLTMILLLTGCAKDESITPTDDNMLSERGFTTGISKAVNFYGLSDRNDLLYYKAGPPAKLISTIPILGLRPEEHMLAIDFRVSTDAGSGLLGVSDSSVVYLIDISSGYAKPLGARFEPAIKGSSVGFDINPKNDEIRLVTDEGQNLRIDPATGAVLSVDTDLNPAGAAVSAAAYSRTPNASRNYDLFDIDVARGVLMRQNPPDGGTLTDIGSLGLTISGEGGFDIGLQKSASLLNPSQNSTGLAVLYGHSNTVGTVNGDDLTTDAYRVYEISLTTGKTTYKGLLDRPVIGIAIP